MPAILLVESEPAIHLVVQMILERHGYEVLGAHTAREARVLLQDHRPAAALVNMVLVDGNGLDVCREIRAHPTHGAVPALILCGRCRRGDPDRARLAGADRFETLPFNERAVLNWLREQQLAA